MARLLQAEMDIAVPPLAAAAPPAPLHFLLKLPAAAAALPHATLDVTQMGGGSLATVQWQRSLSGPARQTSMPLDIDLDTLGALSWPQQEPAQPSHAAKPPASSAAGARAIEDAVRARVLSMRMLTIMLHC